MKPNPAMAALALVLSSGAHAQERPLTATGVVAQIRQTAGVQVSEHTVDTFKAGDSATVVKGIAVTMMATLDVLQRAAARGHNLIITHEPTFYSHRDTTAILEQENDPVLAAKQKFIREHGLVIWRFHDLPHAMKPDMITTGIIRALGWENHPRSADGRVVHLPPVALRTIAGTVAAKLGAHAVRISGDPAVQVSRVAITQGFPGFAANRRAIQAGGVEALIMGEDHEWETIEYAVDAISAGLLKGLIVVGHIPSEQAGMEEFARWLRTIVPGIRVELIPAADPFRQLRR